MLAGDAFAPGGEAFGFEFDEQDAANGGDAEAGLEGVGEGQLDFAEVDGFDFLELTVLSCQLFVGEMS